MSKCPWAYPEEVKTFIVENVTGTPVKELVEMVNAEFGTEFTISKMRSFMKNHNLRNDLPTGLPRGRPTERYPVEIRDYIKANYKGVGAKEMTERIKAVFGVEYTYMQMKGYYGRHKLDSGLKGYFEKGQKPWNTGMKGLSYEGSKATQFKPGQPAPNWVPVGTERITADGYVEIKVREKAFQKNWKGKHILVWEEHNGPVPVGHVVIFGDGDKRNFDPDNLLLVSRAQLIRLNQNQLIQEDVELTKTGIIIADVYNKIGERKRKKRRKVNDPKSE